MYGLASNLVNLYERPNRSKVRFISVLHDVIIIKEDKTGSTQVTLLLQCDLVLDDQRLMLANYNPAVQLKSSENGRTYNVWGHNLNKNSCLRDLNIR